MSATPKGKIISITPEKMTEGAELTLTVKWKSEWSSALGIVHTVAGCYVTTPGGEVLKDVQEYYNGSGKEFTSTFDLGVMPAEPVVVTVDTYQQQFTVLDVATWAELLGVPITGGLSLIPAFFMNIQTNRSNMHADGPYTKIVQSSTKEVSPPVQNGLKYLPWILAGVFVMGGGAILFKSKNKPAPVKMLSNPRRKHKMYRTW